MLNLTCVIHVSDMQLEHMLLQSAKLQVMIRRHYARIKKDQTARYFTYVLQLQNNKFYVGSSDSIYTRLMDHSLMSASSSIWVRQHGPVTRVIEISRDCNKDDETYKTLEYMSMFGWHNVRGGSYCRSMMRSPPTPLADFVRDPTRKFDYLTRREIDDIVRVVRDLAEQQDAMSQDGHDGHDGPDTNDAMSDAI